MRQPVTSGDEPFLVSVQQQLTATIWIDDPKMRQKHCHELMVRIWVRLSADTQLSPAERNTLLALSHLARARRKQATAEIARLPLPCEQAA